jgi:hypothetical protein
MPCDIYTKNGKAAMFICCRGRRQVGKCQSCGKPATKLCDYPLSGKKEGQTCDRKLCDDCATVVDMVRLPDLIEMPAKWFLDSNDPRRKFRSELDPDTVDVCPAHARFIRAKEGEKR